MSAFSRWSLERQKDFWLGLARRAIQRWSLPATELAWLAYHSNAVFQLRAGERDYVLRIRRAAPGDEASLRSELAWLRLIRQRADLIAPSPIAFNAASDDCLLRLDDEILSPSVAYCSLFQRIAGESKTAAELDRRDVFQVGAYLGRLHRDAQSQLPAGFTRPRLDGQGLFGAESPYASAGELDLLSREQREILAAMARRTRPLLDSLTDRGGAFGMIHADLLAKNLIFSTGGLGALDFEHCGWGYFLYDLAPLLWQLKGERAADYACLEDALWRGYAAQRAVDAGDRGLLEPFIAARQLASIRWLLRHRDHATVRAQAPTLVRQRVLQLQGYLETGVLQRRTRTL